MRGGRAGADMCLLSSDRRASEPRGGAVLGPGCLYMYHKAVRAEHKKPMSPQPQSLGASQLPLVSLAHQPLAASFSPVYRTPPDCCRYERLSIRCEFRYVHICKMERSAAISIFRGFLKTQFTFHLTPRW